MNTAPEAAVGRLEAGAAAPLFHMNDIFGREISLEKLRGKKSMISFYRYASCPLCNLRIARLIQLYPEYYKRGLRMFACFQSSKESILHYVGRQDAPFPIIADPEHELYRLYGVESSWGGFARSFANLSKWHDAVVRHKFRPGRMEGEKALIPADFLIDSDLVIRRAYYGRDIGDHLPLEEIDTFLA